MEPDIAIAGLVLAGGAASRMGGRDKGLLEVDGRPILARVLEALRPGCDAVLISANGDPARFAVFGHPVVPDRDEERQGPLAGVLAGLDAAASLARPPSHVLTVPTDTPFLPSDLATRLVGACSASGAELACARSGGRRHPVVGLWPLALRGEIEAALRAGERRLGLLFERHATAEVDWPVEPLDPFFNVNTPDDLATAEALARNSRLAPPGRLRL